MWERRNAPPVPSAKETPALAARRPALAPGRNPSEDGDAFGEWLGHIAAGRVEVR